MHLVDLPVELLETIFSPLPPSSLTSLARTTTAFYPTATRILYRRVSVSSFARNLAAVTTLATRRHLALLVRYFSISLDDDGKDQVDGEYYTALAHALRGMHDLISLELTVNSNSSWILASTLCPPPGAAAACSISLPDPHQQPPQIYPRLEHFSCSFPLDADTAAFLERTPQLKSLQLATMPHTAELSPTAIPRLDTYTGPPCLLQQLVLSQRPITSLHLSGDLSLGDIEHLARASANSAPTAAGSVLRQQSSGSEDHLGANVRVEALSVITSAPPVAVLEALADACPSLVCLRLITTCAFYETPDVVSSTLSYALECVRGHAVASDRAMMHDAAPAREARIPPRKFRSWSTLADTACSLCSPSRSSLALQPHSRPLSPRSAPSSSQASIGSSGPTAVPQPTAPPWAVGRSGCRRP